LIERVTGIAELLVPNRRQYGSTLPTWQPGRV
jgi:hypothetical protein